MIELRLTIEAPELSGAIKDLADALRSRPVSFQSVGNPAAPVTPPTAETPVAATIAPANAVQEANPTVPAQTVPAEPAQTMSTVINTAVQNDAPASVAQTAPEAPVTPAAPIAAATTPVTYTLEDITNAGSALLDAGKMGDLMKLLSDHGVQAVTQLKSEQYPEIAAGMRALGAKI